LAVPPVQFLRPSPLDTRHLSLASLTDLPRALRRSCRPRRGED
jgi:hypothetical protein